jgi:Acetyltransferase (GNAT) family
VGTKTKANIIIKEATRSDNEGLVYLTSLTPMKGNISIRIDRKPDFFRLLEMRGLSFVIVAELNNDIIGSYSASAVDVFIDGKQEQVYYLGDFRVHPDHRKSTIAARLAKAMLQKLESLNADLLFCTAAYGNDDVIPFFKGRAFIPLAKEVGIFNVLQIIPTPFKTRTAKYHVEEGPFASSGVSFFNNFMTKFQLGSVYSESSLENTTLITASFNNTVIAAITLFDAGHAKQNVLIRLPLYLKSIFKLINAIKTILPVVTLPEINEVVRILYIKSFACEPGHEQALKSLLGRARNIAYEKKYTFLAVGIHEKDPFIKIFSNFPKFTFKSRGFITSLKGRKEKIDSILKGIPFEDYSLV